MPKLPKPKAAVIPMPLTEAARIRELRLRLRESNAAIDTVIALLDAMQRPQRARNLALVRRKRRVHSSPVEEL
jgi:hypothetical protein